jgi:hypothetical protein
MRSTIPLLFTAAASLATTHCATSGNLGELRTRAAFDLACPSDSLQTHPLSERTVGVDGCGKRATYVWAYQNQSWILDSRSGGDVGAMAAASLPPSAAQTPSGPPSAAPTPTVAAATIAPASTAASPARQAPDPKVCDAAHEYRRRAASASDAAQAQLLRMAERKEAECRQSKEP